jgi:hypothetical protein
LLFFRSTESHGKTCSVFTPPGKIALKIPPKVGAGEKKFYNIDTMKTFLPSKNGVTWVQVSWFVLKKITLEYKLRLRSSLDLRRRFLKPGGNFALHFLPLLLGR